MPNACTIRSAEYPKCSKVPNFRRHRAEQGFDSDWARRGLCQSARNHAPCTGAIRCFPALPIGNAAEVLFRVSAAAPRRNLWVHIGAKVPQILPECQRALLKPPSGGSNPAAPASQSGLKRFLLRFCEQARQWRACRLRPRASVSQI
jgi:hypothetical protein